MKSAQEKNFISVMSNCETKCVKVVYNRIKSIVLVGPMQKSIEIVNEWHMHIISDCVWKVAFFPMVSVINQASFHFIW